MYASVPTASYFVVRLSTNWLEHRPVTCRKAAFYQGIILLAAKLFFT